jgi:hypothetical protein
VNERINSAIGELANIHTETAISPRQRVVEWRSILLDVWKAGFDAGRAAEIRDTFVISQQLGDQS